jgi:hypothetical protein
VLRHASANWNAYRIADIHSIELPSDRAGILIRIRGKEMAPLLYVVPTAATWHTLVSHLAAAQAAASLGAAGSGQPQMVFSDDRRHWWDGANWNDAQLSLPPGTQRSPDGHYWWDGVEWRTVPGSGQSQ